MVLPMAAFGLCIFPREEWFGISIPIPNRFPRIGIGKSTEIYPCKRKEEAK